MEETASSCKIEFSLYNRSCMSENVEAHLIYKNKIPVVQSKKLYMKNLVH